MRKIFYVLILVAAVSAPVLIRAQGSDGLEQVSPEDLRQLQDILTGLEETPADTAASAGNDFNLDLVWKTNTLVPYDYPAKALPGALSSVVIYALADYPNPQRLNYTWLVDDISSSREGPDQAGIGRNVFNLVTFQVPKFTHRLRVVAQDPATEKTASAALELTTVLPEAYFYTPNNNVFNALAANVARFLAGSESNILTRLFYFNARALNDLEFNWTFNNQPYENTSARADILPVAVSSRSPAGYQADLKLEVLPKNKRASVHERASVRTTVNIIERNQ